MSLLKKILTLSLFLLSLSIVFIKNTYSKEKVIDGINDLIFKFPADKGFFSKYSV